MFLWHLNLLHKLYKFIITKDKRKGVRKRERERTRRKNRVEIAFSIVQ